LVDNSSPAHDLNKKKEILCWGSVSMQRFLSIQTRRDRAF
jgi:hypothetical protein